MFEFRRGPDGLTVMGVMRELYAEKRVYKNEEVVAIVEKRTGRVISPALLASYKNKIRKEAASK